MRCIALLLALLAIAGCCAKAPEPPVVPPDGSAALESQAAETPQSPLPISLAGKRFISVEKREAGMSPNGIVMGHWYVTFENDREVHWRYSDVIEAGTYELANDGVITVRMHNHQFEAKYDPATGQLHWQDMIYRLEAPAAG